MKEYPVELIQPLGNHNPKSNCVRSEHVKQYIDLPFEFLNPLQSEFLPYLEDDDTNIVVAAPTSSGKTLCAELFAARGISLGKKILYIAPMKALADEKYEEWAEPSHTFNKFSCEIITGDFILDDIKKRKLNNANIICLTPEMFNSKCRFYKNHAWLHNTWIVVDECFPGNTKVYIDKNVEKTIENIYYDKKISHVLSYNHEKKIIEKKKILRKIKKELSSEDNLVKIIYFNENNNKKSLVCTKNHKIWASNKGYVEAENLENDDIIKIILKENKCPICDKNYPENFLYNDCRVIDVKKYGNSKIKYVYNLEIEDNHNYFANHVLVSNCHLIGMENRGDSLEIGLVQYHESSKDSRSLLISATIPNVKDFGIWLEHLSGRKSKTIVNNYRPCKLNKHFQPFKDADYGRRISYSDKEQKRLEATIELVQRFKEDPTLVFVGNKDFGNRLSSSLKALGIKYHFHNADLDREKRHIIEKGFKNLDFNILIATTTLAWGCFNVDSQVLTEDGFKGISDKNKGKIVSFKDFNREKSNAINKVVIGNNIPMKKIILKNGLMILCTEDHSFPIFSGGEKKANELEENDELILDNNNADMINDILLNVENDICFDLGFNACSENIENLFPNYIKISSKKEKILDFNLIFSEKEKLLNILYGMLESSGIEGKNGEVYFYNNSFNMNNFFVLAIRQLGFKTVLNFLDDRGSGLLVEGIKYLDLKNRTIKIKKEPKGYYPEKVKIVLNEEHSDIVFDMSIAENDHHHYIVNGIVTHNCNTPARYVVQTHTSFGMTPMHPANVIQSIGRAGRAGYSDKGDAYILVGESEMKKESDRIFKEYKVTSVMNDINTLMFHVLSYVVAGKIKNSTDLYEWYKKTLSSVQKNHINEDTSKAVLENLKSRYMIRANDNNEYEATKLGEISAQMYMSPLDLSDWFQNFSKLKFINPPNGCSEDIKDRINLLVAKSFAESYSYGITKHGRKEVMNRLVYITNREKQCETVCEVSNKLRIDPNSYPHVKYIAIFYSLLSGRNIEPLLYSSSYAIKKDIDRVIQSLKMSDQKIGKIFKDSGKCSGYGWNKEWDILLERLKYGVDVKYIDLVRIQGIGKAYAERLFEKGIKTINDVRSKPKLSIDILGNKRYQKIMNNI